MNDNGNIRLLTPENDIRVRVFLSSLEDLSEKVEKIRGANKPSLDGERYYTDKELAVKLKVSRRSLQDYRNNGRRNCKVPMNLLHSCYRISAPSAIF